jgi:hypothetical protein
MSERIERERDRELGERRFCREAQETRASGQASGPRFFWVLFFGGAKKSTSPVRAKPWPENHGLRNVKGNELL